MRWPALIAVGGVLAAGCGGDAGDDARSAATTATEATAPEPALTPEATRERRRLVAKQAPVAGRLPENASDAEATEAVEAAVAEEARRRQRSGDLRPEPVVRRAKCSPLRNGTVPVKPAEGELLLGCTAITSSVYSRQLGGKTVLLGFEFRARVKLGDGTYAYCAVEVTPAEGGSNIAGNVPLSPRCSG